MAPVIGGLKAKYPDRYFSSTFLSNIHARPIGRHRLGAGREISVYGKIGKHPHKQFLVMADDCNQK